MTRRDAAKMVRALRRSGVEWTDVIKKMKAEGFINTATGEPYSESGLRLLSGQKTHKKSKFDGMLDLIKDISCDKNLPAAKKFKLIQKIVNGEWLPQVV